MEIAPKRDYVYEKCDNGLKGGLCMVEGGNPFAHLSVPIGVIVIRTTEPIIPQSHYEQYENTHYNTIDDEMFDMFVNKCSQYVRNHSETRKKTHKQKPNVSRKKLIIQ